MEIVRSARDRFFLLNPPYYRKILRDYYCCTVSKAGYLWHPIDLLVQSGILGKSGTVAVLDAVAQRASHKSVVRTATDYLPTAVFCLVGSLSIETDAIILKEIKEKTGATIVVSGDACLENPEEFLDKRDFIDAILFDFTSSDIVRLATGDFESADSSAFRRNGKIEVVRTRKMKEFEYPVPDHEAFEKKNYNMPLVPESFNTVLASFGCPYFCAFCNSGALSPGFSFRNHENMMEEIASLYSRGARHIFFKDMTFGVDSARVERLCRALANEATSITWHAYTRLDLLDERRIEMYSESGCRLLQIGIETSDKDIGRSMGKEVDIERAREAFNLMRKKGIIPGSHFILGLPGESAKSAFLTAVAAVRLDPGYASFNVFDPRPGSKLCEIDHAVGDVSLTTRLVTRFAYALFYLRPRKVFYLARNLSLKRSLVSFAEAVRSFLFMPVSSRGRARRKAARLED
ncbi:MAG TPA: radical SAM protein [bacterium]|nr:radical SAM protein [bacterium]